MSEFNSDRGTRIKGLISLFHSILYKDDPVGAIKNAEKLLGQIVPSDIIFVVDELVQEGIPMEDLKTGINKFLNQLHKAIRSYPVMEPAPGSFIEACFKNNEQLDIRLKALRPDIKTLNSIPPDKALLKKIKSSLEDLLLFEKYYIIKENILFPVLEQHWPNFRCLGVMWSFHDDIRRDIRALISMVSSPGLDVMDFNRVIGRMYFNMYAIKFREEAILLPYAMETLPEGSLDAVIPEAAEIGFPYAGVSRFCNRHCPKKRNGQKPGIWTWIPETFPWNKSGSSLTIFPSTSLLWTKITKSDISQLPGKGYFRGLKPLSGGMSGTAIRLKACTSWRRS